MAQVLDNFGCINNTIKVSAGHYFDLKNPNSDSVDIESIAAALSKTCRYGGHCPKFYSVAEHSVLATLLAKSDGISDEVLLAILLHDAAEAYVGDVVKPLKVMLTQYSEIEKRVEAAIEEYFSVSFSDHAKTIKRYDRALLKTEKTALWPDDSENWAGFETIDCRNIELEYWIPDEAEFRFLSVAERLGVYEFGGHPLP